MGETGGHGDIRFLGPVMLKPTNAGERDFYARIFYNPPPSLPSGVEVPGGIDRPYIRGNDPELHDELREFVPTYYGMQKASENIILENLAFGLESPRFMDVKIGYRTVSQSELVVGGKGESAAWKKKLRLKLADYYRQAHRRGFTIVAAKGFADVGRNEITRLEPEKVFKTYFGGEDELKAKAAGLRISAAAQLDRIIGSVNWSEYAMVACSVLFVLGKTSESRLASAKAAQAMPEMAAHRMTHPWVCRVRLIDFAHSYHQDSRGEWGEANFRKYSENFSEGIRALSNAVSRQKVIK